MAAAPGRPRPIERVLVAGSSGLIGTELVTRLRAQGTEVVRLVRRTPSAPDEVNWTPGAGMLDWRVMDDVDAVVNLAGASISRMPWTKRYIREMTKSRVDATRTLCNAMADAKRAPAVFVSGSAYGYYGDAPGKRLTEESPKGDTVLADLAAKWEETARLAPSGTRVVTIRTGIVLGPDGLFPLLRRLVRFGLGSHLGSGGQHWPWVSVQDEARAIIHLLTSGLSGAVNVAGPTPATASRVIEAIAGTVPAGHVWFTAPQWAIEAVLGEAGRELILASDKVIPARLLADGFEFEHRTVSEAAAAQVG